MRHHRLRLLPRLGYLGQLGIVERLLKQLWVWHAHTHADLRGQLQQRCLLSGRPHTRADWELRGR